MGILRNIVDDNKFTPEDIPGFEAKLFFEGSKWRVDLERFAVLLFLSTVIATYGVIGDSTATVIGAMIIAPLMRPIMATAAGLVMGDMVRAGRSILVVVLGVIATIFTAWFIGLFLSTAIISFTDNSQIISRVSPSLTDLFVALASGAAGAFAMSRSDVADSLPGVAIAIALVPPLAVVGLALSGGQWDDAWGALILFLTNFLSILLAGGGVFALLGLSAASTKELADAARRKAFIYIAIGILLVTIPLGLTSYNVARETIIESETQDLTEQWLQDTAFVISDIEAKGDIVTVIISGFGDPPPIDTLGEDFQQAVGPDIRIRLRIIPSQSVIYPEVASN